jgi:hypothetical protein
MVSARMRPNRILLGAAALALLTAAAPPPEEAAITLRPVSKDGAVVAIDVTMKLSVSGELRLDAPVVYPGAPGTADRMQGITVTDRAGKVPLTVSEDPPVSGGFPYLRHWQAGRAVSGPVRVSYRALVMAPGGPGGPAFGIRAVDRGVVGAGSTLLLFPVRPSIATTRVHWDLSRLPPGSIAAMSHGDGDLVLDGPPSQLAQSWFMAGPLGRFPAKGQSDGFSAYWLGTPTFDAPAEMAWTARAHHYLARHFPHLRPTQPYRVFLQFRDRPPFGGATALHQSFMLSRGPLREGEAPAAPRLTLFHEMIHMWVGGIEAPVGVSSWFSEGLTTYYEYLLPMRGGFITLDDYGREINRLAESYYTNKARNWSAEAITKVGFTDEEIRHLPYRRSALYFADLDARIRAASGSKRNLESLLFPMFLAREAGETFDQARWIAMVTDELGPQEKTRFERLILEGADTIEPDSNAFGPCFRREAARFTRDGQDIAGFRWVRVADVAEASCVER